MLLQPQGEGTWHLATLASCVTELLELEVAGDGEAGHLDLASSPMLTQVSTLWPQFPDVVPSHEHRTKDADTKHGAAINNTTNPATRKMETMFLISIILLAVVWLYLFPPPD